VTDRMERLLREIQGFAASMEANYTEAMRNLALEMNGHPKAQDFEPTGHGGSDPTSVAGTVPDTAALEGKRVNRVIEAMWRAGREGDEIVRRHLNGVRPEALPLDDRSNWCVLHLELDAHEPRYRNDLCRPCSERKYQTGDYPSLDDIRYHTVHARWPRKAEDPKAPPKPKPRHIAGLENLQDGLATLKDN